MVSTAALFTSQRRTPSPSRGPSWRQRRSGIAVANVPSQRDHIESALERRGLTPDRIHEIRNPLGSMEAASERAKANTMWWRELNGDQQRALIHEHPEHIGKCGGHSVRRAP